MNNTDRFTNKGELYAQARPRYAGALFAHFKQALHIPVGSVFADIGAGTGIFSEQLLQNGYRVYAVEPNSDMRKKAEEKLSANKDFFSVNGTDASTTLPAHSVDYVTAAQAFHWFDQAAFKKECARILKPGGRILLVYNSRDLTTECNKALADLCHSYCPTFEGFSKGTGDEACRAFFENRCEVFCADNYQVYDRTGYTQRILSSSYALREGDVGYSEFLDAIHALFDTYAADGLLTVPMQTVAYISEKL